MIFGVGLPRTGTKSLAKALEVLDIHGQHYCVLNKKIIPSKSDTIGYIIDNSFYKQYQYLFKEKPASKYILTTRERGKWLLSCKRFQITPDMPDIIEYKNNVIDLFKDSKNLLVMDINVKYKWSMLCSFLNKPIPDIPFPGDN